MSSPNWKKEQSYCTNCKITFEHNTPDPICPKCGSYKYLVDVPKENPK